MLRSPAYCVLSLSARRVLDRLEIELADHGGADNGRLPVTYDDFQRYGLHRQAIYPAIRETVALGFAEITEEGVAGGAEFRKPNLFRLTYRHAKGGIGDGTHEWMKIETDDEARRIADQARAERPIQKQFLRYGSRQKSVRKPYRKRKIHSTETTTTAHSTETTTTIDISSVTPTQPARAARPPAGAVASGQAAPERKSFVVASAAPPAAVERPDLVQNRLAARLGSDGWLILQGIDDTTELERLTILESRGELDEAALEVVRAGYRRAVA
jgi:hypothetical protein